MASPERQRIEELVVRYQLEPSVRDVFVEGRIDRCLLQWFLAEMGFDQVTVKEIDSVEVPFELLTGPGFERSTRGLLVALAHEFKEKLGEDSVSATCVIDGDFDLILGRTYSCNPLMHTDFTSLEMYCFEEGPITKTLQLAVKGFPENATSVIRAVMGPLQDIFLLRLANFQLGLNLRFLTFEKYCSLVDRSVEFDQERYLEACLNASNLHHERERIRQQALENRSLLTSDPRIQVQGHDFFDLITWYVRRFAGFGGTKSESIKNSLFAAVEVENLKKYNLFRSLVKRVG